MPDKYANQAYVRVIPTLNTLSFEELATFVSVFEKKAFLINRVEYLFPNAAIIEFDAEADYCSFGLSTANTFTLAGVSEPSIFDFNEIDTVLHAAGVASFMVRQPFVKDLSTLPGGGSLIPARPVFLWLRSVGWVAANYLSARIHFTVVDLKAEEYWELVEATRLVGS